MPRVLIGGDICPIGASTPLFLRGDAKSLFNDLLADFHAADLVIANLECPLITKPTPIAKTGPTFGESAKCVNAIREAGIDVLCLANNHILDHGPEGLASTIDACNGAGLAVVGAGANLAAAGEVLVRQIGGFRIGVLAMAEHEFSIATANTAGANPLDVIRYVRTMKRVRKTVDYVIVLLHGGAEFLTAPSPRLKETCHFLVEMGANAVIVQHPHSLGGYETYLGGHIIYGQGALMMDEEIYRSLPCFHESVLVALDIHDGGGSMEFIPFVQAAPAPGARKMEKERAASFLAELAVKAEAILDDNYISAEWRRFCEEQTHDYLSTLLSHNVLLRKANRDGRFSRVLYNRRRLLGTRNVVCCESHREALETIFKDMFHLNPVHQQ